MTTVNTGLNGEVGAGIQASEGTGVADPLYAHPVYSGLPKPAQDSAEIEVSTSSNLIQGHYIRELHGEFDFVMPGVIRAIGLYFKGILPALTTTGVTNYAHVFTLGTGAPPFLTLFGRRPGGPLYEKYVDSSVSELGLQFKNGEILKVNVKGQAYTPSILAGAYAPTNTETLTSAGPYLTMIGSTVKIAADSQTPVTTGQVQSGTLRLRREATQIQTDKLNPSHRNIGRFRQGADLSIVWANYDAYRATYYGAAAGSVGSTTVVYGSLDLQFEVGPGAADANKSLKVAMQQLRFVIPEPPDVDPAAGSLMLDAQCAGAAPTSGEPVTVTLKNTQPTY